MTTKGKHQCPICGSLSSFTITDLDRQVCDTCKEVVSIGQPVRELRKELIKEQEVDKLLAEGSKIKDEKGIIRSDKTNNDLDKLIAFNEQLISMLNEMRNILEDNMLLVGENKEETESFIHLIISESNKIKKKYS